MNEPREPGDVPPEDRRRMVLKFIDEHDMPLPPLAIFAGLKRQEGITFAYRTVQNILSELVEKGDLMRVDTQKLRDGEIEPVPDNSSKRRSYYFVTESGSERVNDF